MDVREKLAELLKSVLPNFRNNMAYWGEKPIYEFADCLLANGVTVQEWISVNDRLPEESGNYIVCCDDSSCSYGEGIWYSSDVVVVSEYYEGSWIWYEGGTEWSLENIVTHWMPLPQPPKGE